MSTSVLFQKLVDEVLDEEMKPAVAKLLAKKIQMAEKDTAPRVAALDDYIVANLEKYKALADSMVDDRNGHWTALNEVFIQMLMQ